MRRELEKASGEPGVPSQSVGTRDVPHASSLIPPPSSLILHLFRDPPASGAWNMAVDEALLEAAATDGQCALRFYGWEQPTLSLGYFQTYAERWQHVASAAAAVVRRVSGGGAILHDDELTYSFAIPAGHPLAAGRLQFYTAVHAALIEVLTDWGIQAHVFEHPPDEQRSRQPEPFLCFQRRSPGDVLVGETKIAGSAQRRCRGAVLQHGSVLLGRSAAAPELAGLRELTGKAVGVAELRESWRRRLAERLAIECRDGEFPPDLRRRAALIAAQKYVSPAWTQKLRAASPL